MTNGIFPFKDQLFWAFLPTLCRWHVDS